MMKPRRRVLSGPGIFLLGVCALLVAGVALKRPLVEKWHLRRLESGDAAQRRAAATRLGEMRSIQRMRGPPGKGRE